MKPSPYRRFRVRHHVSAAAGDENQLPKPTIDPTAFADVPEEFKDQRFLSAGVKANPLRVTFPIPANYSAKDTVDLLLDEVSILNKGREISPQEYDAGLVIIEIPSSLREVEKEYIVTYGFQGRFDQGFQMSLPASFRTKYTPAGDPPQGAHLGPLAFADTSILKTGLNSAKLTEMGNVLTAFVPSYKGSADGDLIHPEVVSLAGVTIEADPVRVPIDGTGGEIKVEFTRANLEAVGDGVATFRYSVEDLAGNSSLLSRDVPISLSINSTSIVLDPPTVPVFKRDGIIYEANARPEVDVEIPGNAGLMVGDIIYLFWGTQRSEGMLISAVGEKVIIGVRYRAILEEGTGTIPVTYSVYRAGELIGAPENPTEVKVNLDQPGGKDPDPETPANEALAAPTVHEAGWVTGQEENIITLENSDRDAHFIVQWYNTLTPKEEAFIEGDVLEFFYNSQSQSFGTHTISSSDVKNKANIDVVLPAAKIQESGSGTLPAYYLASRTVADGVSNSARSPDQSVTVESTGDLPGGGGPLDLAIFPYPAINTPVVDSGSAKVTVPKYKNMKEGDRVAIQFTANWAFSGVGPEITRAFYQEEKQVNPAHVYAGEVTFDIPSEKLAYLHPTALGHLIYTATNEHGSVTSERTDEMCDTRGQKNPPDDPDRPNPPIIE